MYALKSSVHFKCEWNASVKVDNRSRDLVHRACAFVPLKVTVEDLWRGGDILLLGPATGSAEEPILLEDLPVRRPSSTAELRVAEALGVTVDMLWGLHQPWLRGSRAPPSPLDRTHCKSDVQNARGIVYSDVPWAGSKRWHLVTNVLRCECRSLDSLGSSCSAKT